MTFRQWLKNNLVDKKYTRAGIARAIGVSKPAVDKWLAGNGYPKVHSLYYLCSVLFPSKRDEEYCRASSLICKELACGS
tara:strand:- start:1168 stop:1404 length:237 start_codon:yes stop_codon:yes gene_type:complete